MVWEYLVETFVDCFQGSNIGIVKPLGFEVNLTLHLASRGKEGWELVQCMPTLAAAPGCSVLGSGIMLVFKRLKK